MLKNPSFAWAVAVVMTFLAVLGWYRALTVQDRADTLESASRAREQLRLAAEQHDPAIFVRVDGDTIVYRVAQQIQRDGQTFIDQVETSAILNPNAPVFGVDGDEGAGALLTLAEGTPIRIRVSVDPTDSIARVNSIYVLP